MDLASVMQAVADRLDTITELNCFGYPADSVTPPAVIVDYPEEYTFDETYGRGMDRMDLTAIVVVGKVSDASTRDSIGAYCNGSGTRSFKAVLESGTYTAFDELRVTGIRFGVWTIAGTDYMAAIFDLDIAGRGA